MSGGAIMETRTYNVYKYNELTKEQKEKAIENYGDINTDYDWYGESTNYYKTELEKIGLSDIDIFCSGFFSQGDGACFVAKIFNGDDIVKFCESIGIELRPMIKTLLKNDSIDIFINFYKTTHNYSHENTVSIEILIENMYHDKIYDYLNDKIQDDIINIWRVNKCKEIYKTLEKDYDYLTSEEVIAETLIANDYDFNERSKID